MFPNLILFKEYLSTHIVILPQELNTLKFLQTLLIILVVFVSIRLLWRIFGRQLLKWLGMKALQRVQKSFNSQMGGRNRPQEPSNTTSRAPIVNNKPLREKKKVGEYVDFEEID